MTQVEKREYSLAILIILLFVFWPGALLYYFTRPKTITQQGNPQSFNKACTKCGRFVSDNVKFCPSCGKELI